MWIGVAFLIVIYVLPIVELSFYAAWLAGGLCLPIVVAWQVWGTKKRP